MDTLQVRLYCTARVFKKACAVPRTYWATEERYPYGRKRRDMVEIDRGHGRSGIGQLIAFVEMDALPVNARIHRLVIIRWLSPSPRSHQRDDCDRPLFIIFESLFVEMGGLRKGQSAFHTTWFPKARRQTTVLVTCVYRKPHCRHQFGEACTL